MVAITPISKANVTEEITQKLKDLILSGHYAPGERLPSIKELADALNVAQPSLREALRYLESLGMVHIRHGAGVFVGDDVSSPLRIRPIISSTPLDSKVLQDLMDVRQILETSAAELAAKHTTPEQLDKIHQLLTLMEQSIDKPELFSRHNADFHIAVCEASNNSILLPFLSAVRDLILAHQEQINISADLRQRSLEYHRRIFEAIQARDPELARQEMAHHLSDVQTEINQ